MLKLTRDKSGNLIVESLNGKKLKVQVFENGFRFNSKWWPREEGANMLAEVQQELGPPVI